MSQWQIVHRKELCDLITEMDKHNQQTCQIDWVNQTVRVLSEWYEKGNSDFARRDIYYQIIFNKTLYKDK